MQGVVGELDIPLMKFVRCLSSLGAYLERWQSSSTLDHTTGIARVDEW